MWTPQEILTFHIHATEFNMFRCVLSFKVSPATFLLQLQRFRARQKNPLRDLSLQIGETGGNVAVSICSGQAGSGSPWRDALSPWMDLLLAWPQVLARKAGSEVETAVVGLASLDLQGGGTMDCPHQPTFSPAEQSLNEK